MQKEPLIYSDPKKQERYDRAYMKMALEWAKLSHCKRKQVGALIVKEGMIISDGYNGTPTGFPNDCEDASGTTHWYVLHAEANAIMKVARSTNNARNAALYLTHSPCRECSKLILQAGIKRLVYLDTYKDTSGLDLLRKGDVLVQHLEIFDPIMYERPRTSITAFFPLLLAVMLAGGIYIGQSMQHSSPGLTTLFGVRSGTAGQKIDDVLDLVDRQYVDTVDKKKLTDEVIEDLLQRLDPHSYYISAADLRAAEEPLKGSFDGIGVEFTIQRDTVIVISPVEGGPSAALGVRAGDRIIRANGKDLAGVKITNEDVMKNLRGPGGSEVTIALLRKGRKEPFNVTIKRGKIPINSVAVSFMTDDGTGYIKLVRFAETTYDEFMAATKALLGKGMKRMVLDLRGNGGGLLDQAIALADEFLPKGRMIVYTEGRMRPREDQLAESGGLLEDMPLAVLIDEGSASASEILAGALQDNDRGTIIGRRSFGKGLVQQHMVLPDSSAVRITTARYYTPSGRSIQRPYGEGIDYVQDFEKRYDDGELLSADSIHLDTTKVYTTVGGRKVYGGGGVMPDVFVPSDTSETSAYLSELYYTGALNQFAFDAVDAERKRFEDYGSATAFIQRFVVDDRMLKDLATYAARQGVPEDASALVRSHRSIASRLKADIARNIWGEGYYRILLNSDNIFLKAKSTFTGK